MGYVVINNRLTTAKGKRRKWTYAMDPVKPEITIGGEIGVGVDSAQMVLPVRNPVGFFRAAFMHALADEGIVFVEDHAIPSGIAIKNFTYSSAPLLSLLGVFSVAPCRHFAGAASRVGGEQHHRVLVAGGSAVCRGERRREKRLRAPGRTGDAQALLCRGRFLGGVSHRPGR